MSDFEPFGPNPPDVDLDELATWIVHEDADMLVIDKPGWLVCHPSKRGPRSSLVGACREWTGLERMHLVSRLDRETSGLVVLAKHARAASRLQKAVQDRRVDKLYLALLDGQLEGAVEVDAPLGPQPNSAVRARVGVSSAAEAKAAQTRFEPLPFPGARPVDHVTGDHTEPAAGDTRRPIHRPHAPHLTLARVLPRTGRKHQIRAHAAHIGHAVVGDKIYGPDETLFLDFIESGWTDRMAEQLPIKRQALHLARLHFRLDDRAGDLCFEAPLPEDMRRLIGSPSPHLPGAGAELSGAPR